MNQMNVAARQLFGGAIEAIIPARFSDVSAFRQVPDNQEVFADADSDQSIIVEIVEAQSWSNEESANQFFQDLCEVNEVKSSQVIQTGVLTAMDVPNLPQEIPKFFVIGEQSVSKYKESDAAANRVQIYLANFRFHTHQSEILITLNVPVAVSSSSSSASVAGNITNSAENVAVITGVLRSFVVRDWRLFNGPDAAAAEGADEDPASANDVEMGS